MTVESSTSLVVERTSCRADGGQLAFILDLGVQKVMNMGDKPVVEAPLVLVRCVKCGLVQLRHTVSRDYCFREGYPYKSGATQTMKDHLKGIVDDVMARVDLKSDDIVVDIGSNDGTLLWQYPYELGLHRGFEPSQVFEGAYWSTSGSVKDFFTEGNYWNAGSFNPNKKAKVVTAIAMFYDLEDPCRFLRDVKSVLAPDGLFVVQVNNLLDTLGKNAVGDICHEHLEYYSQETLVGLLRKNGFLIDGLTFNDINGGSMRVFARHMEYSDTEQTTKADNPTNEDFQEFVRRVNEYAFKVKAFVVALGRSGKKVDAIGASTRGGAFLQYAKIGAGDVRFVIERDQSKVGKFYLGIPVVSEDTAFMNPPDAKLVMPYWFAEEIEKREKEFVDKGGMLVYPLPVPRVVTKDGEKPL